MAPEVRDEGGEIRITAKADMYSLGIIIMDLLVGYMKRAEFVMSQEGGRLKINEVITVDMICFQLQRAS